MKAAKAQQWSRMNVMTTPTMADPKELTTILTFSLRDLYGDFEPHSCMLEYSKGSDETMIIKCPVESVKQVRAALTLVTPPSYIATSHYRFDVVSVVSTTAAIKR